jgi:hypothetical protein
MGNQWDSPGQLLAHGSAVDHFANEADEAGSVPHL